MNNCTNKADIHVYYCRNAAHGNDMPPAISRLEIRSDIKLEPVSCTGKVDPRYLLKAFEAGASAVAVLACPSGHCKMMQGNLRASSRVSAVRQLMAEAGVDPDSLQIFVPGGPEMGALEAAADNVAQFVNGSRQPMVKVTA